MAHEMRTLIVENTWLDRKFMNFGWGNGYVLVPEGHPAHGLDYATVDVSVHGGLTFGELVDDKLIKLWEDVKGGLTEADKGMWAFGFDTCHGGDNQHNQDKVYVQQETESLFEQLANYVPVSLP